MSSRTVHVRLKDKSICALIKYLEAEGRSYEGRPLSTVMSLVIDGMAANLTRRGVVPDTPTQEAVAFLNKRYSKDIDALDIGDLRQTIESGLEEEGEVEGASLTLKDKEVRDAVMRSIDPDLMQANGLEPGEEIPEPTIDLAYPPWANQSNWTWEELIEMTPKDLAIDTLASIPEGPQQELYKRAVEMVYTGIDYRDWGSEATMKKITKLYGSYQPWVSIYKGQEGT
jgi:hypothetical protein